MIIDTHAHYDDNRFDEDREELLRSFPENGVGLVVNIGASIESTRASVELSQEFEHVYAAVGVHPEGVEDLTEQDMLWLAELASRDKVVAIGEIGLDYYYEDPDRDIQKFWFERQLELAHQVKLPIIIHSRDAAKDTLDIMKAHHAEELGGVIHCFSYSWEMARIYLDMGFYLGIGGVITFKNSKTLKDVVTKAPLERLVLETDSPYLTPVPNRGHRNDSRELVHVVAEIARLKGVTEEEVMEITERNARQMYRLA